MQTDEVLRRRCRERQNRLASVLPVIKPTANRYGAAGVWVGTRFVASEEADAPPKHKELVLTAGYDDTARTLLYSGRPMRVRRTLYVADWYYLCLCSVDMFH